MYMPKAWSKEPQAAALYRCGATELEHGAAVLDGRAAEVVFQASSGGTSGCRFWNRTRYRVVGAESRGYVGMGSGDQRQFPKFVKDC
mmetsp:Transcript_142869/g.252206  ORF Transcript_142869/g.252206 Transcript_142869/m.252206 type:complete len:87 (+) Transcript_142869:790-1050(+)